MSLTPEEQAQLAALQTRQTEPEQVDVAQIVESTADAVASVARNDADNSHFEAQNMMRRQDARIVALEAQVQEANARLAELAAVALVANVLDAEPESGPETVVVVEETPAADVTEVEGVDAPPTTSPPTSSRKRPLPFGRR
jgi:hypothetical protein